MLYSDENHMNCSLCGNPNHMGYCKKKKSLLQPRTDLKTPELTDAWKQERMCENFWTPLTQ